MVKILRTVAVAIVIALFLQLPCYASAAASTETGGTSQKLINVESLEEGQGITMEKGKSYILSYPISNGDWKIFKIRLQVKTAEWFTVKVGEENAYLKVEEYKAEEGRVAVKITCKTENIATIRVILQNEITKEQKGYNLYVTDKRPVAYYYSESDSLVVVIPGQPDDNKPGEGDDKEELIVIDTSGWVFQGVQKVYDGKEYVALVSGLPDYVKPVYKDNTRTNAGSNKAYVTFEVPEGYAVPEGMETDIIIDKATIQTIELDRMWMQTDLANGTIKIQMPDGVAPAGIVKCTYEVNGKNIDSNYKITDTGVYSVLANFSLADGMEQNYNLANESSKVTYLVQPDMYTGNNPKFNLHLDNVATEGESPKIAVWIEYTDDSFSTSTVSWKLRYDTDVLELDKNASTKGPTTSYASRNPYVDGDDSSGRCLALASGNYADGVTLQNLVFNIIDENAKDIVVNITAIEANDSNLSVPIGEQTKYTHGYGIVLNQEAQIIGVTLPGKATTTKGANANTLENSSLLNNDGATSYAISEEAVENENEEVHVEESVNETTKEEESDETTQESSVVENSNEMLLEETEENHENEVMEEQTGTEQVNCP